VFLFSPITVPPPSPVLSVNPSSLDFGSVPVGQTSDLTFTVQNTGGGTLTGNVATSGAFSIIGDSSFSLTANQSKVITVRFSPTTAGSFAGNVNVTSNGGNASVLLSGGAPGLSVTPPSIDFQSVAVGGVRDSTLTVQNTGGGTLTGRANTSTPFSIVGINSFSLTANQNKVITVRFSPQSLNIFNSNVTTSSNAGNSSVLIAGIGLEPALNPNPPKITSISPQSGLPGGTIAIVGLNFGPIAGSLSLGSTAVAPLSWNDTFIQFLLPNITAGKYTLQLTTSASATTHGSIRVLPPPPDITSILPTSGAPGTTVMIEGFNFGDQHGNSTISIGGQSPEIVSWENERIAIKIPTLAPKSYPIQLTTAAGQAKKNFTVRSLFLILEEGPCDNSFLGTLAGTCWVTSPNETKANSDGTVNIAVQNIRRRWYEVTVSGASFSGPNPFLLGPDQTLNLNKVTVGPEGNISFYADGMSNRALLMDGADLIFIAVTGNRMPISLTDKISSLFIGICETTSALCSFSRDLVSAIRSGSLTQILLVLTTLPVALADDPITHDSFIAAFGFSASQEALIGTLGGISWIIQGTSVVAQELVYLTAPRFAKSCLLTPANAGTCH
jgi:hypothetical protein